MTDNGPAYARQFAARKFEDQSIAKMVLLDGSLADIELPSLTVMVGKAWLAMAADLGSTDAAQRLRSLQLSLGSGQ